MSPLLEMRGIKKRFPGVTALDGVDFELERGEVHVILGENGAGKSTLIKMLSGAYQPDEGEILLDGQRVDVSSATVAQSVGISTIYQEFNLVPQLTVAENILLGRQPRRLGLVVDRRRMNSDARKLLEGIEVRVDPDVLVSALGVDGTRIPYRGVPGHGTCISRRSHRLVDLNGRRVPAPKRFPAWIREACPRGHALDAELEFEFEPGTGMRIAVRILPR